MGLDDERRAELSRKGAVETTVGGFFGTHDAGMKVVEWRVRIAKEVRRRRLAAKLTQKSFGGDLADLAGVVTGNPVAPPAALPTTRRRRP